MLRPLTVLLFISAVAWPGFATAEELPPQTAPQLGTDPSGFVGVVGGPGSYEGYPAAPYRTPQPSPPRSAACPTCPPVGQVQPQQSPGSAQH
jgi:hypothetical protein